MQNLAHQEDKTKYILLEATLASEWDSSMNTFAIEKEDLQKIIDLVEKAREQLPNLEKSLGLTSSFVSIEIHANYGEFTYYEDFEKPEIIELSEEDFEEPEQYFESQTIKVYPHSIYIKAWGKYTGEEAYVSTGLEKIKSLLKSA